MKLAHTYLAGLKDQHSKLDDLKFTKFEAATYLFDPRIKNKQKR